MAATQSDKLSVCKSYTEFTDKLKYHRGNSKTINDQFSAKSLGKDASAQLLRGSFVEIVATWEKYVHEILKETVETVFKIHLDANSAQSALAPTQSSRELFKRALVHYIESSPKRSESTSAEDKPKKKIANLSKREVSTVELSVRLVVEPDLWKELMVTFKKSQLKRCDHIQLPLFCGEDGIDNKFKNLFGTSACLSDIIIEMGPLRVSYIVQGGHGNSVPLVINSSESLHNILRLYYGARCAFAHGQNTKTFQAGGALDNFPSETEFQKQVGEKAGNLMYILFRYVRDYGNTAWIYYPTLVNLQRFMKAIAFRVLAAISKWVYDEFKKCIWNFDPQKFEATQKDDDIPASLETSAATLMSNEESFCSTHTNKPSVSSSVSLNDYLTGGDQKQVTVQPTSYSLPNMQRESSQQGLKASADQKPKKSSTKPLFSIGEDQSPGAPT